MVRQLLVFFGVVFLVFGLAACGDTMDNKGENSAKSSEASEDETDNDNDNADNGDTKANVEDIGEVIAESDVAKTTLINIEHETDDNLDTERYILNFEIENKSDRQILVQSREELMDGDTINGLTPLSEDIEPGEKVNGLMQVVSYSEDLSGMDKSIEFLLVVVDTTEESHELLEEHDINIE